VEHARPGDQDAAPAGRLLAGVGHRGEEADMANTGQGGGDDPDLSTFRTDRPDIRKVLGDLEADVMEVVWARPADRGTTVRDVFEVLYDRRRRAGGRSIAYTTVMNTMARLARKKVLRAERADQAYVYYPTLGRDAFVSRFVGRILADLLVSFSGPTLEQMGHLTGAADAAAGERVRRLLDEIARRRREEPG
jgi:predicted transcriptional regulator